MRLRAAAVLFCLALPLTAFSQSTNATLGGTIEDPAKALVPGVTVTAKNTATGITSTTLTNESGVYNFPSLQPGTYVIQANLPGFQPAVSEVIRLSEAQSVNVKFVLQIQEHSTGIDVTSPLDITSSIGTVISDSGIRDLPFSDNVLNLINSVGGVQDGVSQNSDLAGNRASAVNTTLNGQNVADTGRAENGVNSIVYVNPDLIAEVKVILSPVDAEMSRGSGQVRMTTRSGTNAFHGSVFWKNRNSFLGAGQWFDNFNNVEKAYDNSSQFGGSAGGPIFRNKTFFYFLFDGQRDLKRQNATGKTLTAMARQGIFRYFPGADNADANNVNRTVDRNGNPVRPAAAFGDLAAIDLFGNCTFGGSTVPNCREYRDDLRPAINSSTFMQETLRRMPQPNDFTGGDGLNTAQVRFPRRVEGLDVGIGTGTDVNRDQYNLRIDHQFNTKYRLSLTGTKEKTWAGSATAVQRAWPEAFDGLAVRRPDVYMLSFTSYLSPNLVNDFRAGRRRSINLQYPPANRSDAVGVEALKVVPVANGVPFQVIPANWSFLTYGGLGKWRGHVSPMVTIGDDITWLHGTHVFKAGAEWRNARSGGFGDPAFTPLVTFGIGNNETAGLESAVYSGLTENARKTAQSLLTDLTASIDRVNQSFGITSANDTQLVGSPIMRTKYYRMQAREMSAFFKDEWKFRPDLTLSLGLHWEYYGQPFEESGLAARVVGDESALTGVTCTSSPGTPNFTSTCSNLTRVEFVGRNSTHPGVNVNLKGNDLNNFAPAVGFTWRVPWFGGGTVLRSGYGINYVGALKNYASVDNTIGQVPGINLVGSAGTGLTYKPPVYTSISTLTLPIPFPDGVPVSAPFIVSYTDRTLTIMTYNRVSPYIQNWNLEIERKIKGDTTIGVRYIGTKGTKLRGTLNLNQIDALSRNRPLFDAFNAVRAGGESPLLDQMLSGINLGGTGAKMVNGTSWTGAKAVRTNPTTRAQLANGNVGAFLNFLNTNTAGTGSSSTGAILRKNGFPENYIVVNPQYSAVSMQDNLSNSTYHALQTQFTRRFPRGLTFAATWTWSKTLGDADSDPGTTYRDPSNRSLEKTNLGFDRAHQITSHGIYKLPFGKGRSFLGNAPSWVQHLAGDWQLGGIMNYNTGAPLSITSDIQTITTVGAQPNIVGALPHGMGKVTKTSNGVNYFNGFTQTRDPGFASISTSNDLHTAYINKAIVDPNGTIVLVNPQPGEIGTLGHSTVRGPASLEFDANVIKRFPMSEGREFEFRIDALNVLNHPNFGTPDTNINGNSFGQITSAGGARSVTVSARINF